MYISIWLRKKWRKGIVKKQLSIVGSDPWVGLVVIPPHRFLSLHDDLGNTWRSEEKGNWKTVTEIGNRNPKRRKKTLSDGLLVVADVVNGGGDFPVQRATNVEDKKKQKRHHHSTENNLWCRWTHFSSVLFSITRSTTRTRQTLFSSVSPFLVSASYRVTLLYLSSIRFTKIYTFNKL